MNAQGIRRVGRRRPRNAVPDATSKEEPANGVGGAVGGDDGAGCGKRDGDARVEHPVLAGWHAPSEPPQHERGKGEEEAQCGKGGGQTPRMTARGSLFHRALLPSFAGNSASASNSVNPTPAFLPLADSLTSVDPFTASGSSPTAGAERATPITDAIGPARRREVGVGIGTLSTVS